MSTENNKNSLNKEDLEKNLQDIFDDDNIKASSNKPVSTVVGNAFDIIEQKLKAQEESKKKNSKFKQTLIGIKNKFVKSSEEDNSNMDLELSQTVNVSGKNNFKNTIVGLKNTVLKVSSMKKTSKSPVKNKVDENKPKKEVKEEPKKEYVRPFYVRSDTEDDIFDEEGYIYDDDDEKLSELKNETQALAKRYIFYFKKIINSIFIFINRFVNSLLKIGLIFLSPVIKLVPGLKNKDFSQITKKEDVKNTQAVESKKVEAKKVIEEPKTAIGKFDDMINLNIIFTDNYDADLYKKNNLSLTKAEEELIMINAIIAIQQCSKLTKGKPQIEEGHYKDNYIHEIMENVKNDDISLFLGYVKSKPKKYIGKKWKISETFATWLLKNSPLGKEKI